VVLALHEMRGSLEHGPVAAGTESVGLPSLIGCTTACPDYVTVIRCPHRHRQDTRPLPHPAPQTSVSNAGPVASDLSTLIQYRLPNTSPSPVITTNEGHAGSLRGLRHFVAS